MAPRTDLNWSELNSAFGSEVIVLKNASSDSGTIDNRAYIDLSALLNTNVRALTDGGVIKVLVKLLEIARNAQENINEGKPAGERMAAFTAPTIGGHSNGFVPVTRSISSRYELSTAISIEAITA